MLTLDNATEDPVPEVTALLDNRSISAIDLRLAVTPEQKMKAYEQFLTSGDDTEKIALDCGIPVFLAQHWIATERWGDRKAQFQAQIYKKVEMEHQRFILDHRLTTAQRHLATAKVLEDEVKSMLDDMALLREKGEAPRGKDMSLVRLSQALKNATDISARVVGISDTLLNSSQQDSRPSTVIVMGARPVTPKTPFNQPKPIMATVSPAPSQGVIDVG